MKKTFFIIGGFVIILLIGIAWIYLFLFGAPENTDEIFAQFGIGGNAPLSQGTGGVIPTDSFVVTEEIQTNTLRQLTTRPIAGMTFIDENTVRYMERGTGYIYDLPLNGGVEQQVSYTTNSKVTSAHFSSEGNRVIYETETATGQRVSVGAIGKGDDGTGTLTGATLLAGAHDARWNDDGVSLSYLLTTTGGSEGRTYHSIDQTDRVLFTIPLREARPIWGSTTYLYTTPSAFLQGYVYEVKNGELDYIREGAPGLTAFAYQGGFATTEDAAGGTISYAYQNNTRYQLPLALFPEKCTSRGEGVLLCASPSDLGDIDYPDTWYKGVVSLSDLLWHIDISGKEARLISNPQTETGRMIDVQMIVAHETEDQYLLLNKNDMTLWLFTPGL